MRALAGVVPMVMPTARRRATTVINFLIEDSFLGTEVVSVPTEEGAQEIRRRAAAL
jgi:hypothetical protein